MNPGFNILAGGRGGGQYISQRYFEPSFNISWSSNNYMTPGSPEKKFQKMGVLMGPYGTLRSEDKHVNLLTCLLYP